VRSWGFATTHRLRRRRTGVSKPNLVAAAVRLAGGPGAAATICGVSRQTIYDWINERRVERLIDALRLSRASGVAIENLAGDDVEKLAAPVRTPRPKRRGRKASLDSPGR
jgi:DNA-binding XRE family transcriptional regulator